MPVGTQGSVKGIHPFFLREGLEVSIFLANTYHLFLRPGARVLRKAGGLHGLMGWERSLLTDSGGYQIYSLALRRKIGWEGVWFKSHLDGTKYFFSPEKAMVMQRIIGADLCMAFDECTSYPATYEVTKESMERTHHWLERSVDKFESLGDFYGRRTVLFPIVQGGMYEELRRFSAKVVSGYESPGYAIGGLSVGESAVERIQMVCAAASVLPWQKARYLMGVGTPLDLLEAIGEGVDMFDCVIPTRHGRNGLLYTTEGVLNIFNRKWREDFSPLDSGYFEGEEAFSLGGAHFSKAYVRHLFVSKEILGGVIGTLQNLHFYMSFMRQARRAILRGDFVEWRLHWREVLKRRL